MIKIKVRDIIFLLQTLTTVFYILGIPYCGRLLIHVYYPTDGIFFRASILKKMQYNMQGVIIRAYE